jgi:FdrA protein
VPPRPRTSPYAARRTSALVVVPRDTDLGTPMPVWNIIHKGLYHDSVTLMRLTRDLESVAGVRRVAAMMATPSNRTLLRDAGLLTADADGASPNDLIIAVEADEVAAVQAAAQAAEAALSPSRPSVHSAPPNLRPHTLQAGLRLLDGANLALISVPGLYAGLEAMKALRAGLHVMLFSNNVPVVTELELKRLAVAKNLLMMGPDCGTAIINGVPLGFANAVPRGRIGLAAASGTGLQEVACLIAAAGEGISQAIGVGGRDLADEVGGLMTTQALEILHTDPLTEVICLLSKPPGPMTWAHLPAQLARLRKPCIVHFSGVAAAAGGSWYPAATLEDAALAAVALARGTEPQAREFTVSSEEIDHLIEGATRAMRPGQRLVRGIYAGGTLAYEALRLLQAGLATVTPEELGGGEGYSVVDLGEDRFTVGRPHPMIDGALRRDWILQAAQDSSTAVILLDVILGYGAHPDPTSELLPAIQHATRQAQATGRGLAVVASVCGTEHDPQRRSAQVEELRAHGVIVMPSNAQAARLAALIGSRLAVPRKE